jgi:hypothetical protein
MSKGRTGYVGGGDVVDDFENGHESQGQILAVLVVIAIRVFSTTDVLTMKIAGTKRRGYTKLDQP